MNMPLVLLNRRRRGAFNPAYLFALAEPGVWYDPSDLTTLYQDNAGTTPVTAPGQTVGLMLDKSQGLVLGSELVTNGTFDSGTTGWVIGNTSWNASSGVMLNDGSNVGVAANFQQYSVVTSGRTYRVTFDFSRTSGSLNLWLAGSQLVQSGINTSGTKTFTVLASVTGSIFFEAAASSVVSIDNISVKLLAGNHATQATSAQRPTYGINPITGTRNLLLQTEDFSNVAWVYQSATRGALTTAPDGTSTAQLVTFTSQFGNVRQLPVSLTSGSATSGIWIKRISGNTQIQLRGDNTGGVQYVTNINITNDWAFYSASWTHDGTNNITGLMLQDRNASGQGQVAVWHPQFETGSTATAYQKVVSQYEVTEAGVQSVSYLAFDGVDDGMVTNTITPAIDKVQVFVGTRKLSDAAEAIIAEFSPVASNNGSFVINSPFSGASSAARFLSRGTGSSQCIGSALASPISFVATGVGDIANDTSILRVNGSQQASNTADQGTGNFLAYPLYIGRRAGSSLPYNGRLYSLITRFGANLTDGQITATEAWVNSKVGAY